MKHILGFVLLVIIGTSCAKEENFIPDYPINYNVTVQEFSIKANKGVLLVPNYGVAGLVIYRSPENYYYAYDRCSTVNPERKTAVVLDENGLTVTDPISGAKYSLIDGSPVKAPAETSLKKYTIILAGSANSGTLQVRN